MSQNIDINSYASHTWDCIVGSQTPAEFMKISRQQIPDCTIDQAVKKFLEELKQTNPEYLADESENIWTYHDLLVHYIEFQKVQ
jgi:ABC-type transporter MlaC component